MIRSIEKEHRVASACGTLRSMDAMDAAEQEGAAAGALSPSQLGAAKTLVQMCGSAKQGALGPLRKLVTTDSE